ncbi:hypothetical protein FI667_g9603, partial [Globisporangium splendens]
MDIIQYSNDNINDLVALIPPVEDGEHHFPIGDLLASIACDAVDLDDIVVHQTEEYVKARRSNPRKRTYEVRKSASFSATTQEEKDLLAKELSSLEAKLDYLKHCAGIPNEQSIAQSKLEKALLREIFRNQQYLAAGFKSTVSANVSEHMQRPISTSLHLGCDPRQRQQLLNEIRPEQLCHAKRFIEARTQFIHSTLRSSESTKLRTKSGDSFAMKVDVIPLPQATSVKQVHDAILFHLFNVDVCLDGKMRNKIVLREKDESGDECASQHRVRYTNHGVDVEFNSAVFAQYTCQSQPHASISSAREESGAGAECVIATTFIDRDDLYPYRPREWVRQDITTIWTVTRYAAKPQPSHPDPAPPKQVIVLKRWAQSKLHPSELDISEDKLTDLTEETLCITNAVLTAVCASLQPTSPL